MNSGVAVWVLGPGRLGRAVARALKEDPAVALAGGIGRGPAPDGWTAPFHVDLHAALASGGGVVIDAAGAEGAEDRIDAIVGRGTALVEAATGLGDAAEQALARAARRVPVVVAPNGSLGVALLRHALRVILRAEGPGWDVSLVDRHHRAKRDAPSGTARLLEKEIQGSRRDAGTVQIASFRQGGVIGEHEIVLAGAAEEIVLTHRALDRSAFARGLVRAAVFAAGAPPGLYRMDEVLGLTEVSGEA